MANVTYPGATGIVGVTEAANFIPEIWSDEIVAAYKRTLMLGNIVSKMPMSGKKGDKINVPSPTRGVAAKKLENAQVTIQANVEGTIAIDINRHFEYSRFIEDIVDVQALSSLRQFYTNDAGYALAKQVDTDLFFLGTALGNGVAVLPEAAVVTGADWDVNSACFYNEVGTEVPTAYAIDTVAQTDVFTDAFFRAMIQKMDDADVPMDGRSLVVPPSVRNQIMGISRYVSSDFVNGKAVNTGKIGELYGIDVYVSSNCPVIETAANNTASSTDIRAALLIHKDTFVHAEQLSVRSQTQYKQEFLSNLYTSDTIYGKQVMRPDAGFVLALPN